MNYKKHNFSQKGAVLLIAMVLLGVLGIVSAFFISFVLGGAKISFSHQVASQAYYLTEAGVNEAIWKLKNDIVVSDGDDPWQDCFMSSGGSCANCADWSDTFMRHYTSNSTTTVLVKNFECAHGEITATTTVAFEGGKNARRVVKARVFKALGSLTNNSPVFTGSPSGEGSIMGVLLNVYNGNMFSNNNFNIKGWSVVKVFDNPLTIEQEGQILTNNNMNITNSAVTASSTCAKNSCTIGICAVCPAANLEMPAVDFDSAQTTSYKSRAQSAQSQAQCEVKGKNSAGVEVFSQNKCVFTGAEFSNLLWQVGLNGTLFLNHKNNGVVFSVYYVDGKIELKGGRRMQINGVLVANDTIDIGEKLAWSGQSGTSQITINDPGNGFPSGILTKDKMNFGPYSSFSNTQITGLIYAQDEIRITSMPNQLDVIGGIIARKLSFTSLWSTFNLYLDNDIIKEGIWGSDTPPPGGSSAAYSPVVTVEHWEETY